MTEQNQENPKARIVDLLESAANTAVQVGRMLEQASGTTVEFRSQVRRDVNEATFALQDLAWHVLELEVTGVASAAAPGSSRPQLEADKAEGREA